jgi:tRNA U54 and U55 pseudouridine synthase Pus10
MLNKKQEGSKTSIFVMLQAKNNPPYINVSSNVLFFNATYWKAHREIPLRGIGVGDPDERDVLGEYFNSYLSC